VACQAEVETFIKENRVMTLAQKEQSIGVATPPDEETLPARRETATLALG